MNGVNGSILCCIALVKLGFRGDVAALVVSVTPHTCSVPALYPLSHYTYSANGRLLSLLR